MAESVSSSETGLQPQIADLRRVLSLLDARNQGEMAASGRERATTTSQMKQVFAQKSHLRK
ncbi:MAG: hypothetical protein K6U88_14530, partial [Dehalococcoidia bacterium]|nr:hypothetical protein [Dehalococcoidia bacterium]